MAKYLTAIFFCCSSSLLPAQDVEVSALLKNASEHLDQDAKYDLKTLAVLHAVNGEIDESFRLYDKYKELDPQHSNELNFYRIAILTGHKEWLKEHEQIDWDSDGVISAQMLRAAIDGEVEVLKELAPKLKDKGLARSTLCQSVHLFKETGHNAAAIHAFSMALNASGELVNDQLLETAIAIGYGPLIQDLYRRWNLQEGINDWHRLDMLRTIVRSGCLTDANELAETLQHRMLRKSFKAHRIYLGGEDKQLIAINAILKEFDELPNSDYRDPYHMSRICELMMEAGRLEDAEELIDQIAHKIDRVPLFARLSHAWLDQGDKDAARRVLDKAIHRIHTELRNEASIQYASQVTVASSRPLIGAAAIRLGDTEGGELFFSLATERAMRLGLNNTPLPQHAVEKLFEAFKLCDAPERSIDLLIKCVNAKRFTNNNLVAVIRQLDPSIQEVVKKHGRRKALEPLKVLNTRTPRVTLIELVAKAQLRHEGPNADLSWVLPRKKDVPLTPLYLSVAKERSAAPFSQIVSLINWN